MNIYAFVVIGMVIGYLAGSIPFGLIVGKLFYKIDVRKYGSGNLGATNVARNLGTKPGLLVLFLDLIKAGLPAMIMYFIAAASITNNPDPLINSQSVYLSIVYCATGVFACLGHCNPIFAGFKGGKAVASIAGFVLFMNWRITLLAFFVFLLVALTTKIISLKIVNIKL